MTTHDPILAQITQIWGETLRGDESPEQTIRPAPAAGQQQQPSGPTVSIPPGLETEPEAPTTARAAGRRGTAGSTATAGFQVLRMLGRGGMGVVYAARQGSLEREVALKMPLGDAALLASADARFVSEALVTGDLDHPNIVPVHDLGRDESGRLYMAMKLVRGTPWQRLLHPRGDRPDEVARADGMALRDQLEVLLKVTDAVAFGHSRGVLHRDLKPENVMVGAFGEVLVMDWGLALDVSPGAREVRKAQHRSEARGSAGTPSYMSPELALADYERIGVRSDVYLLGAILYELLTGGPPHRGRDVSEVLAAAARGEVQAPELRAPQRGIPRELSGIALRALAPDPVERYPDVQGLQRALRSYLAHEESLRLAGEAREQLLRLSIPGEVPREERYALFGEALSGFGQALHLWSQNETARAGRVGAALDLADEALERGDVGLARAQLVSVEHDDLQPARVASLRAAVAARSVSRLRSRLGAAGVAALLAAGVWGVAAAEVELEARRTAEAREQALASRRREAWSAAREGDVAALSVVRAALESAQATSQPDTVAAIAAVGWAREVLLWQQGRWSEIAEPLAPAGVEWREPPRDEPGAPRAVPAGHAELCSRLLGTRELAESPLAAPIAALCARGRALSPELFGLLRETGRRGADPAVLRAARGALIGVDAIVREARPAASAPAPDAAARFLLQVSGLFAPAVEAAIARGDAPAARGYQRLLVPFQLSSPPFGEPLASPRPAPRLVRRGDGSWAALEPTSGGERWRTTPLAEPDPGGTAIPIEDGSVVVAAGSQVVRLDGSTGRVLGRMTLDGAVCVAWPDPEDRSRLVLLVMSEEWRGQVHEVRLQQGVMTPPAAEATDLTSLFPLRSGAQALRRRLRRRAEEELGEGAPGVSERVTAGLRAAASSDRHNADLWLAAMQEAAGPGATQLREELARATAAAEVSGPADGVRIGIALERTGFRQLAQAAYERAAGRFLDLHGNPDLATQSVTPALQLRQLGAELFASGDTARALELLELGRRFATFLEDDARFYRRYALWLREQGRDEEAALIGRRAQQAGAGGRVLLVPGHVIAAVDVSVAVLPVATLLLGALLLRGFLSTRAVRHADLYARGWRRAAQRWSSFATQSVDRLSFVFLAYLPRSDRLVIALLATTLLGAAAVMVGGLRAAHVAATTPYTSTSGYLSSDAAVRYLEDAARTRRAANGPARDAAGAP